MNIKYAFVTILIFMSYLILPDFAFAHPGRTDSAGCHTCRTNCPNWGLSYGEYHCHNAKSLPQPKEPIRSHYGENGTGTTESWSAYKSPNSVFPSISNTKSSATNAVSISHALVKGMRNDQVTKLQQILANYPDVYPEGLITGYFGEATERAVKRFQSKYSLEPVGYVGPKTRVILNSI